MRRLPRLLGFAADFAAPTVAYYLLRHVGVGEYLALLAGAGVSATSGLAQLAWRRARGRSGGVAGIPTFMVTMTLLSLLVSLVGGGPRFLLARDAALTAAAGGWFLGSLWTRRPLTFVFTRPLLEGRFHLPGDWSRRYEESAAFRRVWRRSSVLWAVALALDAAVRVVMAYTLPVDAVPALNTAQYAVFTVLMVVVTNLYLRWAGLFRMLFADRRPVPALARQP